MQSEKCCNKFSSDHFYLSHDGHQVVSCKNVRGKGRKAECCKMSGLGEENSEDEVPDHVISNKVSNLDKLARLTVSWICLRTNRKMVTVLKIQIQI